MGPEVHVLLFLVQALFPLAHFLCSPWVLRTGLPTRRQRSHTAAGRSADKGLKAGPDGIALLGTVSLCSAAAARDLVQAPKLSRQITCHNPRPSMALSAVHGHRGLFLYHLNSCGFLCETAQDVSGQSRTRNYISQLFWY